MMYIKTKGPDGKPLQLQIRPEIILNHSLIGGVLVIQFKPSGVHKVKNGVGTWTWSKLISEIQNWPEVKVYLEALAKPEIKSIPQNNQSTLF
jgi:hypothetical protein